MEVAFNFDNSGTILDFLKSADENAIDIKIVRAAEFALISDVDQLFHSALFGHRLDMPVSACLLSLNAYYSFLGAVRIGLSGQTSAVFPLLRNSLESACYAYFISEEPTRETIWLGRQKEPNGKADCKKVFGSAVSKAIKALNLSNPALGGYINDLYESSIDYGAHPNMKSIIYQLALKEHFDGSHLASVTCLENAGDINIAGALMACAETGLATVLTIAAGSKDHPLQGNVILENFVTRFQSHTATLAYKS